MRSRAERPVDDGTPVERGRRGLPAAAPRAAGGGAPTHPRPGTGPRGCVRRTDSPSHMHSVRLCLGTEYSTRSGLAPDLIIR